MLRSPATTSARRPGDGGFTILEILVALGLVALATSLIVSQLPPPRRNEATAYQAVAALVARARQSAAVSGVAAIIRIEPGTATREDSVVTWDPKLVAITLSARDDADRGYLVAHPDGSLSGARITISEGSSTRAIPGVYRLRLPNLAR
jgi:type II secretory pathway pseudopilin PulG